MRRKIKLEETETPRKMDEQEPSEEKITIHERPTARKEEPSLVSCTSLAAFKSTLNLEKENINSPLKGFISRSLIMDINPEMYLRLQEHHAEEGEDNHNADDDALSIADEIMKERTKFNNRTQGISIVRTSNFLEDFQF